MTKAFYPRLALLLQFFCFPAIFIVTSNALPAGMQKRNVTTIGQNIRNLVDILTADPDIVYHDSMMIACYVAVDYGDHDPDHFHEWPLSSNISEFRDIRCIFRNGGPIADLRRSYFQVPNKWPLHWDQWGSPGDTFYYPFEVLPFSGRTALSYIGAERADILLKAQGHRGPYALVSLEKVPGHPNATWLFRKVQIPDGEGGGERTYFVDVRTGRVGEYSFYSDA